MNFLNKIALNFVKKQKETKDLLHSLVVSDSNISIFYKKNAAFYCNKLHDILFKKSMPTFREVCGAGSHIL